MSSPPGRSSGMPARSEIALNAREALFAEARPLRVVVLALGTLHAEPPVKPGRYSQGDGSLMCECGAKLSRCDLAQGVGCTY